MRFLSFVSICTISSVLIGCANPGDMRRRAPDLEVTSTRPAKSVAICIGDAWENGAVIGTYPITIRPLEDGYTVSITTYPTLFADVTESKTGSIVKFYRDPVSPGFEGDVLKCAKKQ